MKLDNEWHQYAQLAAYLNGRGVPSIAEVLKEIFLQPLHYPFRALVNADHFRRLIEASLECPDAGIDEGLLSEVELKVTHLLWEIDTITQSRNVW